MKEQLPWLYKLYLTTFRELAQYSSLEPVCPAVDVRYGAVLNVQRGIKMRYECHVDSNPIEGLLYVTDHPKGSGGELVVANTIHAASTTDVDKDCSVIYPASGNLVFFDARRFAHYVCPMKSEDSMRVAVAMNYYTPSCPEADRPADLTSHLEGY